MGGTHDRMGQMYTGQGRVRCSQDGVGATSYRLVLEIAPLDGIGACVNREGVRCAYDSPGGGQFTQGRLWKYTYTWLIEAGLQRSGWGRCTQD